MRRLLEAAAVSVAFIVGAHAAHGACVTDACHQEIAKIAFPHQPVKEGDCTVCHEKTAKEHPVKGVKAFRVVAKGGELCRQCHEGFGKRKHLHQALGDGDCMVCHKPHGGSGKYLLDAGTNRTELCIGCHEAKTFNRPYMHGPAALGECTECHDPHESDEKSLMKGKIRDVCLRCHVNFAATMAKAGFVHPPVKDDPCTACHDPHGAEVSHILKKKMPDLCVECHDTIGDKLKKSKVPHKPLLDDNSCASCHSAHFSNGKALLPADEKTVCLNCHGKDNIGKLRNIGKEMTGKTFLHGPIRDNRCGGCHDPHASDYPKILTGAYPDSFYAIAGEATYGVCLRCHDRNLVLAPETTTATNFRNGSRNLHFVHVTGKKKGRTCRACHQTHASDNDRLTSKQGPKFGDWNVPTRFVISPTGGRCVPGCHRGFAYDRDKPVDYPRKPAS